VYFGSDLVIFGVIGYCCLYLFYYCVYGFYFVCFGGVDGDVD